MTTWSDESLKALLARAKIVAKTSKGDPRLPHRTSIVIKTGDGRKTANAWLFGGHTIGVTTQGIVIMPILDEDGAPTRNWRHFKTPQSLKGYPKQTRLLYDKLEAIRPPDLP